MDTKNQFTYFLLSVATGFVGGLLYELFAFIRFLFGCDRGKRKTFGFIMDICFGIAFAFLGIYSCFLFRFPAFRVYMGIGWLLGGIIYSKTLRIIVAFFEKVCYNILARMVKKAKSKKKLLKREEKI